MELDLDTAYHKALQQQGVTGCQVAARLNLTPAAVYRKLNDGKISDIREVAAATGLTLDSFLTLGEPQ